MQHRYNLGRMGLLKRDKYLSATAIMTIVFEEFWSFFGVRHSPRRNLEVMALRMTAMDEVIDAAS